MRRLGSADLAGRQGPEMTAGTVAIIAWIAVGIVLLAGAVAVASLWVWFVRLGKGDWRTQDDADVFVRRVAALDLAEDDDAVEVICRLIDEAKTISGRIDQ